MLISAYSNNNDSKPKPNYRAFKAALLRTRRFYVVGAYTAGIITKSLPDMLWFITTIA